MRRDKNKNRHKKRFITQKSTINPKQSTKNTIGRKNKKQRKNFLPGAAEKESQDRARAQARKKRGPEEKGGEGKCFIISVRHT